MKKRFNLSLGFYDNIVALCYDWAEFKGKKPLLAKTSLEYNDPDYGCLLWHEVPDFGPATIATRYGSLYHQAKVSIRASL